MDRKTFLKQSAFACAACGIASAAPAAAQDAAKPEDPASAFREAWVKRFLKNLDASLPEDGRARFMESCGRDCARGGAVKMAESNKGNVDGMIAALAGFVGKDNVRREGSKVVLTYPECYCPMVSKIKDGLSDTWCHCSRGWVLELFEVAAGKPVTAVLVQSVKRGDPQCRFEIEV
jgi:hypothetical protein